MLWKLFQRRYAYGVAIFAALAMIAYFAGRPVYKYVRNRQLDNNLEKAKAAAVAKDWGTTRNLARSVLLGRRGDFEAFRLWFKALSNMSEPRSYLVAIELFVNLQSDQQDKLDAFRVLCKQAPQAVALGAYASLTPELRSRTDFVSAMIPLLVLRGEIPLAEKTLRSVPDLKVSTVARLELIRVLCASTSPERIKEARDVFAALIAENAAESLEALLLIGAVPGGLAPGAPLPSLPAWIKSQPEAKTLHHLLALNPDIQAQPVGSEALYHQAVERFLTSDPGVLGTWLISHGRTAQVVSILQKPATFHAEAYIARLHAMMKEGMTLEVDAALNAPPPSVDLVELELVRAALAHQRKDQTMEKLAWDRVLQQSAFDQSRNRFLEIVRYATYLGAQSVADDATVASVRIGWGRIPLYQDLLPVLVRLAKQNRTEDLLSIYKTLLRFESGNAEIRNDFLYLGLLHHVLTPDDALKQLDALLHSHPEMTEIQSAIAFASLLNNQPQKVLDLIPLLEKSKRVPASLREALKGAALLAAGKIDPGQQVINKVDWTKMLGQEALVLRDFLVRLDIRNLELPSTLLQNKIVEAPDETPAWRRAVEALERNRTGDVLPPLPLPKVPKYDLPNGKNDPVKTDAS